jgi:Putative neutral zinc metallopeptidase
MAKKLRDPLASEPIREHPTHRHPARVVSSSEVAGARAVLNAAALTDVAGAIGAIMQLLYFLVRAGILGGRDEE